MILPLLVSASAVLAPAPAEVALNDMVENARAANLFPAEGNTISSPANVLMVTIMMAQAVDGGSRAQILQSLHPQMTMADGQAFFQQLAKGLDPETTRLARAVWSVSGGTPAARQGIEQNYGAEVGKIPSQAEADAWADRNTAGMIKQFPLQVQRQNVVIASALSYINTWKGGNRMGIIYPFHFNSGVKDIEGIIAPVRVTQIGDVLASSIPYVNDERLVVLFSESGLTPKKISDWSAKEWQEVLDSEGETLATLFLPKFEFSARSDFLEGWMGRGRPSIASFPGLTSGPQGISFQESAYVRVDEKGTKAASIVSGAGGGGIQTPPTQITVDRPFVFAIVRPGYPLPLFIGTVNEPAITP